MGQGDEFREQTIRHVLSLPVADRIALALQLGDDDLRLFVSTSGLAPAVARQRLRAQRQHGRAPSRCADVGP